MTALRMFIPITKVDAARRLVYGVATAEAEDRTGEVCDYDTTKPLYEKWSDEIAKSTRGKSRGNLRAMHGPVAAGKVTAITFNDDEKQIEICAKVVDDAEWTKVLEGVYTGFSQGGAYERRWTDAHGTVRYTAAPSEISLVDLPCLPQATFEMIKADGTAERRRFRDERASRLARLADELDWLQGTQRAEAQSETDDGTPSTELHELAARTSEILRSMLNGETPEPLGSDDSPAPGELAATPKESAHSKSAAVKIGACNSSADQAKVQRMHDTSVELGAICDTKKNMRSALEKRFDILANTIDSVLQRLKNIEDQPLPLPFLGPARAISKGEDASGSDLDGSQLDKLLAKPETLSVLAIKLAQRNGRSPPR
jgi:hypothetical protein